MMIDKQIFDFLEKLKLNNNRDWFNTHKQTYERARKKIKDLSHTLKEGLSTFDQIEKAKIFRIYRDIRFSKDKTPYKTNFGMNFVRATALRRGGYYLHIEPDNTFVAGGFWRPESKDLKRIRKEIDLHADPFIEIIESDHFKNHFGALEGERLKSAPQGYSKDHEHIDLLNFKQFIMKKDFTDEEAMSHDFPEQVLTYFKAMQPFHDYMSMVLTTDENGELIV